MDEGVHDLRSVARRVHSILRALPPSVVGKAARRAMNLSRKILRWTGPLRDVAIKREGLQILVQGNSKVTKGLLRDLRRQHVRKARKVAKRLPSLALGKSHRGMRRFAKALRKDFGGPDVALDMVSEAFNEVRKSRLPLDPTDSRSIHRLRISLKRFRYVLEFAQPIVPALKRQRTASVQALQRTLGDLRDNDLLREALAEKAEERPELLPETAAVQGMLEQRHHTMMASFLRSVDDILDSWEVLVEKMSQETTRGSSGN